MKSYSRPISLIGLTLFIVFVLETGGLFKQVFAASGDSAYTKVNNGLRGKIAHRIEKKWFTCRDEMICGISAIPFFYERRDYRPAWTHEDLEFHLADTLVAILDESDRHGLIPTDYHISKIKELLAFIRGDHQRTPPDTMIYVDLDILLTDAFLLYASHLTSGRVNPEKIYAGWETFIPKADLAEMLESALKTNSIGETLSDLSPKHPGYLKLKNALAHYREMEEIGEWPKVTGGRTLRLWDSGPRVQALKKRLSVEKKWERQDENDTFFDASLENEVKAFQKRHGLFPDGIVGPKTLAELNVPPNQRIRQIELNLERWRWIPHDMGEKYIIVNIADFHLYVMEGVASVMDMRVVVGKAYRKTPVFSEKIKFLVLNPYWNVPTSIAVKDLLPDICKDITTLCDKNITVFENWDQNAAEIDPNTIDWCSLGKSYFPYKLRQNPGPKNALGRIKFIFPNKHAVYLHDTPQKSLFRRTSRGYSSGCIRIEKPIDLAIYLLKDDPEWDRDKFMAQLETGEHKVIGLKNYMPIHLLYWTAWADESEEVHFREDIYERDAALDKALKHRLHRDSAGFR